MNLNKYFLIMAFCAMMILPSITLIIRCLIEKEYSYAIGSAVASAVYFLFFQLNFKKWKSTNNI
jgi:hypothetical protein